MLMLLLMLLLQDLQVTSKLGDTERYPNTAHNQNPHMLDICHTVHTPLTAMLPKLLCRHATCHTTP